LREVEDFFAPPFRPRVDFRAPVDFRPAFFEPDFFAARFFAAFLPPRFSAPGEFAMRAARCLLMPFLRSPSYCLSSLIDGP
jgi:hypothetical protein